MHWPLTAVFSSRGGGTAFRAPVSADVRAPASAYAPGIPPPLGRHPTCRVAWWNTEFRFRGTTPVRRPAGTAAQRRCTLRSGSAPPTSSRLRRSPRPDPPTSAKCAVKRFNLHIRERYAARALLRGQPLPGLPVQNRASLRAEPVIRLCQQISAVR